MYINICDCWWYFLWCWTECCRLTDGPRYAQTTKLTSSGASTQPPLPSLVSTSANNYQSGAPRPYPFSSMRLSSSHVNPDPDSVHRLWERGRLVTGAEGGGFAWMSPGAPPPGSYRTLPNSPDSNINNNWSSRSGRGPLYFRGHQPNTSGILRDSNKFNVSIEFVIWLWRWLCLMGVCFSLHCASLVANRL